MKRMFVLTVIASFLLAGVSAVFAAPAQGAPTGGKSLYSTRKTPAYRTVQPMVIEFDEVVMPQDDEVEMIVPRRAPEAPVPPKAGSGTLSPATTVKPPVLPTQPPKAEKTESKPEGETWDLSKAIDESLSRPLSGISVPTPPKKEALPEWKPSEKKPSMPIAPRSDAPKSAAAAEPAEVDQFNARLAKIQLEKKNLDETLRLIEKIKSPNFKVKTLVDLAEYVSRDGNYKKEADRLYALAVGAIDALADNKPIALDVKKVEPVEKPKPEPVQTEVPKSTPPSTPRKGSLTLIDEDEPVEKPKAEPSKPEPPKEEKKAATPPPPPMVPKSLTLIDEDDEPKDAPKETPEAKKPEAKLPPPPPTVPKSLTLLDEDDESKDVPETTKKPEEKLPPPPTVPKPLTLTDEKDEPKVAPKEDEKKAEPPKTQRRPMPGRKPIVLSDE